MAYTVVNYKTKKALKEAFQGWRGFAPHSESEIAESHRLRQSLRVYQPGPFGPTVKDGRTALEGPHYPEPHRWYADVEVKNGHIVKIYG